MGEISTGVPGATFLNILALIFLYETVNISTVTSAGAVRGASICTGAVPFEGLGYITGALMDAVGTPVAV